MNVEAKRLYYIDRLRVWTVLSVVPFHAALTYLRFGSAYIKAPVSGLSALPFLLFTVPLGDFFMTLLFFVSGVASFYSFKNRGSGRYIKERLEKLLRPLLLGLLSICPATAYLQALYEGFDGGLLSFIPQFWRNIVHYLGYGHLWFLSYLFVFSMICVPLFKWWKKDESRIRRISDFISKGHYLLLVFGAIILLELSLRPFFPGYQTLILDWANDAVYLCVFIFGYLFAADGRIQEKIRGYLKLSMVCGALSLAALFYVHIMSQAQFANDIYLLGIWALAKGIYECSAIVFLLNVGWTYFNKESKVYKYLSGASFTIYIVHFFPVTLFTWLFMELNLSIYVKFLLVVVLSFIAVFSFYELWRRVSSLRKRAALMSVDRSLV